MMRHDLPAEGWRKSSYSPDNGPNCVECQVTDEGRIAAGDSKNRHLGAHTFDPTAWQQFITAVAKGQI
ncbi:DUF397 domain-containing protein [Streptomyces sp. MNP-20]|uniref:DUF397 domain-containing protein n=1 Tax=Streptomyces sp. MNP-20 TaxID=2721165 RepID=UPI0015532826|nr:DUF397 domain-containing protein [Streptomyces sp. MNP-20]